MRSSFPIFAALLALAVASPLSPVVDPCACDYMCIAQAGPDCACEIAATQDCRTAQHASGLVCPVLSISPSCVNSTTAPAPGPTSHPKPKPHLALEGDSCGNRWSKKCAPDLKCDKRHLRCFDCPGVCRPKLRHTPLPRPVAVEGEGCGSRGMKNCASDLFCLQKNKKCADCPGKCVAMPFPGNSTTNPAPVLGKKGERCGSKGLKTCAENLFCGGQKQGCMDCPGTCMSRPNLPIAVPQPTPTPTPTPEEIFGVTGDRCGSKGLRNCGTGLVCGQQKKGCMDCGGVCEKKVEEKICGGFMGVGCDKGAECVIDEICVKEGGSDCQGKCKVV